MTSPIQTRLKSAREAKKLSQRALSRLIGRNDMFVRDIESRGVEPRRDALEQLAEALEVDPDYLVGKTDEPLPREKYVTSQSVVDEMLKRLAETHGNAKVIDPTAGSAGFFAQALRAIASDPPPVKVYGTAAGSLVGSFIIEDQVIDSVRRPPALVGAPDAYAIFVKGDSMAPAHNSGDLRFVHPHRPALPGDTVVVQTEDYPGAGLQAWIKRLVKMDDESVTVEQFNPPAQIAFKRSTVRAVHKVMNLNELFGM